MTFTRPLKQSLLAAAAALMTAAPSALFAETLTVFAAASLKEALDEISQTFEADNGVDVTVSYAGSSTLARQIAYGAPADVFISANTAWMDSLEEDRMIVRESRVDLVGNALVLIGAATDPAPIALTKGYDLSKDLGAGRLAMALVDAVPAGIYGKAALEHLGIWPDVEGQVAETDNVRAALALVALGAVPLGIVYATDAMAEPRVAVKATFPPQSHPPILYPAALTSAATHPKAQAFLDYLQSAAADDVFTRHGFVVLPE
jgi:molybdate transport system substrate-binding protein